MNSRPSITLLAWRCGKKPKKTRNYRLLKKFQNEKCKTDFDAPGPSQNCFGLCRLFQQPGLTTFHWELKFRHGRSNFGTHPSSAVNSGLSLLWTCIYSRTSPFLWMTLPESEFALWWPAFCLLTACNQPFYPKIELAAPLTGYDLQVPYYRKLTMHFINAT